MKLNLILLWLYLSLWMSPLNAQTASIEICDCPFPRTRVKADSVWCGKLKVPENRANMDGRKLEIFFTVISPADPRPDPIVLMPGGPGIAPVANRFLAIIHSIMPKDHTFIVFDPRGTGLTGPEMCREQRTTGSVISSMDLTLEEEMIMKKGAMMACRSAMVLGGIDLGQYNSVTIAQDVQDLMGALGYKQWNIYGGSYGVPIARMAMRLFPDEIRSAVISNGGGLDMMDFLKYDRKYMFRALQNVANRCNEDKDCAGRYPDILRAFYDAYEWLKQTPLELNVSRDAFEFPSFVLNAHEFVHIIYWNLLQESSIAHLPAFIYAFARRDTAFIKKVVEYEFGNPSTRFDTGMSACVECFDHYYPGDRIRQEKFGEGLHPAFSDVPWFTTECDYWLTEVTDSSLMKPFHSEIPTLILFGEHDPFSTRTQAESHKPWFSNIQISETPGMAHGPPSERERSCWKEIISGFFHDPEQKIDESCYEALPAVHMSVELPGWATEK